MKIKHLVIGAVFVWSLASGSNAQARPELPAGIDPLEASTQAIINRFDQAIRDCGLSPPYVPQVSVATSANLVSYNPRTRLLQQSRWAELPPSIQGLVTAWAGAGTLGLSPEAQFGEIFNSLLVPHELGHYVAVLDGRLARDDAWTNEVLANRIAIAFWSLDPEGKARIASRVANFTGFLNALPNPVPVGEDPRSYFQSNYAALGRDPAAYGWYQGAFMTAAWELREQDDFCSLVNPTD
jgi:hypothetical protein